MKYAAEMGSATMLYIPSFIKTGSVIQKLIGWIQRDTAWRSHNPTLIKKKKKESKLKKNSEQLDY
jgi:hypothetical protein